MGDMFWSIDWQGIFTPTNSLLELVLRSTIMYFVLFGMLRFVLKRQAGGIGTTDVLVIVLLAEVAGNGFAAEYKSVSKGLFLSARSCSGATCSNGPRIGLRQSSGFFTRRRWYLSRTEECCART